MNCVLYSKDLEPITVLKIPIEVQEEIERKGMGRVPVIQSDHTEYMWIRPLRIQMLDGVRVFFTTEDEALALAIKPEFLPGQVNMVNHMQNIIYQQQRTLRKLGGSGGMA